MKNSLLNEIKEGLPDKKRQVRILKEEEHKAQLLLLAIKKRRTDLEKVVKEEEEYINRASKRKFG